WTPCTICAREPRGVPQVVTRRMGPASARFCRPPAPPAPPLTNKGPHNMALAALARKIFGSPSDRQVKRYQGKVAAINALEPELVKLSDDELKARTGQFKAQLEQGAKLDDLLVPAFATVREASKRVLGMRHFDV